MTLNRAVVIEAREAITQRIWALSVGDWTPVIAAKVSREYRKLDTIRDVMCADLRKAREGGN